MYSIKNIFTKSPEEVKVAVLAVVGVCLALFTDVDPSLLETVGAGIALERILNLVYVAPTQRANVEAIALQGVQLGQALGNSEPVVSHVSDSRPKGKRGGAGGQASLPVILVILAVVFALIGVWSAAEILLVLALVIFLVGIVLGTRSRV